MQCNSRAKPAQTLKLEQISPISRTCSQSHNGLFWIFNGPVKVQASNQWPDLKTEVQRCFPIELFWIEEWRRKFCFLLWKETKFLQKLAATTAPPKTCSYNCSERFYRVLTLEGMNRNAHHIFHYLWKILKSILTLYLSSLHYTFAGVSHENQIKYIEVCGCEKKLKFFCSFFQRCFVFSSEFDFFYQLVLVVSYHRRGLRGRSPPPQLTVLVGSRCLWCLSVSDGQCKSRLTHVHVTQSLQLQEEVMSRSQLALICSIVLKKNKKTAEQRWSQTQTWPRRSQFFLLWLRGCRQTKGIRSRVCASYQSMSLILQPAHVQASELHHIVSSYNNWAFIGWELVIKENCSVIVFWQREIRAKRGKKTEKRLWHVCEGPLFWFVPVYREERGKGPLSGRRGWSSVTEFRPPSSLIKNT